MRADLERNFPALPIVNIEFFDNGCSGDIYEELNTRFRGKAWTSLSIDDWVNTADVETIALILTPSSFKYYLPSILDSSLKSLAYLDWGIRALLPHNKERRARGDWWMTFTMLMSESQKKLFLSYLREAHKVVNSTDTQTSFLISQAIDVWQSTS